MEKRARVTRTSEIEMAEETARLALGKIRAFLKGDSRDYKGAMAAQKDINAYIRLRNQQASNRRSALSLARRVSKALKKSGA
ncbi:MAG: hypothetical protein Q8O42_14990 [Acidobacteriota bacterium]|nr:hypothetical protein [Acidobacteriota bacterium]